MTATNQRLESLDVLRGITIAFMIIVNTPGSWEYVYPPLRHAPWNGCTPTDLVFPFFLFIVGLSMAQSFGKYKDQNNNFYLSKLIKRTLIIFGIGIFLNWFPFYDTNVSDLRIFGVLQRIALAYFLAGLIVLYVKERSHIIVTFILLLLYYIILVTGVAIDPLTLENNLVRKIDLLLLGEQHLYGGYGLPFDPEGLLSTLGSVGNVMFGYILATKQKQTDKLNDKIKMALLFGMLLTGLGLVWNFLGCPINKPIWSSSYALFTSGLCSLLLAAMIYIIDVKQISLWSFPFKVFGMNALASYAASGLIINILGMIKINGEGVSSYSYSHFFQPVFGNNFGSFLFAITYCILIWLLAYVMYKRKIFFKV